MELIYPPGATPLDPDSRKGLLPSVVTQRELNEFEQHNIASAVMWASSSKKLRTTLIFISGIQLLHKRMFDLTWTWAGTLRKTDTNLGVAWAEIPTRLKQLTDDVVYWIANETYAMPEIAVRFHHKLVWIHSFPNGNGRLSRLAADLLAEFYKSARPSWGRRADIVDESPARREYLAALREADANRYDRLMAFAYS